MMLPKKIWRDRGFHHHHEYNLHSHKKKESDKDVSITVIFLYIQTSVMLCCYVQTNNAAECFLVLTEILHFLLNNDTQAEITS